MTKANAQPKRSVVTALPVPALPRRGRPPNTELTDDVIRAIGSDIKAGIMSKAAIRDKYRMSKSRFDALVKQYEWQPQYKQAIAKTAERRVAEEIARERGVADTPEAIVDANASFIASVTHGHRHTISKARGIVDGLLTELSVASLAERKLPPGELAPDIGQRIDHVKKLSDALSTLVTLERKVLRIDEEGAGSGSSLEQFLVSMRGRIIEGEARHEDDE